MTQTHDLLKEPGKIHQRLMQNLCPKCCQGLQIIEKTHKKLIRRCETCLLDIHDSRDVAEFPLDICD